MISTLLRGNLYTVRQFLKLFVILTAGFLCMGTVVQRKNAVQKTQTDPILYAQKAKEEAEGKKGPPAPALELFPKDDFMADGPVTDEGREEPAIPAEAEDEIDFWLDEEDFGEDEFKLEPETDDTSEESLKESVLP